MIVSMRQVSTLEELLPLVEHATTAREFGAAVIAADVKPGHKIRLALEARDALGRTWKDAVLRNWLKPGIHAEERQKSERAAKRAANRRWLEKNREAAREAQRRWIKNNPSAVREIKRRWYDQNPDYNPAYYKKRYAEDPAYALALVTRARVNQALRAAVGNPGKARPSMDLLGCSAEDYRVYLEGLFEPGMSWDNWSPDGWHVDHVRPLASFDLSTEEGQRAAFHFTNTRPLWSKANLSKGAELGGRRWRHGDHA